MSDNTEGFSYYVLYGICICICIYLYFVLSHPDYRVVAARRVDADAAVAPGAFDEGLAADFGQPHLAGADGP